MKSTRERILSYLQLRKASSVAEISASLELTRADIRYQINGLVKDGKVQKLFDAKYPGAGRPHAVFEIVQPINLALVKRLIAGYSTMLAALGSSKDDVSAGLADAILNDLQMEGSSAVKLNQAIAHLSGLGIQAKWEAGPTGPIFIIEKNDLLDEQVITILSKRISEVVR